MVFCRRAAAERVWYFDGNNRRWRLGSQNEPRRPRDGYEDRPFDHMDLDLAIARRVSPDVPLRDEHDGIPRMEHSGGPFD